MNPMNSSNVEINLQPRVYEQKTSFGSTRTFQNPNSNFHKEDLILPKIRGESTEHLKYQNKPLNRVVWSVEPNKIMTVPEVQKPSCNFQKQSSF